MLLELTVEDFAIIHRAHLRFGPGLNVLTGETGAGKSLLIDAMMMLLGGRASEEFIRAGAKRAVVTAVFDISRAPQVKQRLIEAGFDGVDLIISREITRGGRHIGRINDRPVTIGTIREITAPLVELHGQHEHQGLLRPAAHRLLLDAWDRDNVTPLIQAVDKLYRRMLSLREQLNELAGDSRQRARTLDLYSFQLMEIDAAQLSPGEEERLHNLRQRLANADRIKNALSDSYNAVYGGDDISESATDRVGRAISELERVAHLDDEIHSVLEFLATAAANLDEAARLLRRQLDNLQLDVDQVEKVEQRWRLINDLKRKYGATVEEILAYRAHVVQEMDRLKNIEEHAKKLEVELEQVTGELQQTAEDLTTQRERAAKEFARAILAELADLAMTAAIEVIVGQDEDANGILHRGRRVAIGPSGADWVEIRMSANPGEPLRPLHKVASGGELSRVMLAIIAALDRRAEVPVMIFDEIDAGIGGRTANAVADKLAKIAHGRQILCVTHLPQIAAKGNYHFCIEKQQDGGRVRTIVRRLSGADREREIARMLAGGQAEVDLAHARALLQRQQSTRVV